MSPKPTRSVQPRLWHNLALAGATMGLVTAPALAGPAVMATGPDLAKPVWLAQAEGGEGGEAGTVASGDETVDFLAGLMQVEGHLATAFALVAAGETENGQAHMGHPMAEVYEALEHELEDLGQPQFEDLLEQLVEVASAGADTAALEALHQDILARTAAAWQAAASDEPADAFAALRHLVLKAGDEWAEGVAEGQIAELHEYQDAWGFMQIARSHAAELASSSDANVKAAAEATLAALAELDEALPAVLPTGTIGGDPALFAAAAAKIELAAFKVK